MIDIPLETYISRATITFIHDTIMSCRVVAFYGPGMRAAASP